MQLRGSASCSLGLEARRGRSARGRVSGCKILEPSTEVRIDSKGQGWTSRQKAQQEQEELRKQHMVPKGQDLRVLLCVIGI